MRGDVMDKTKIMKQNDWYNFENIDQTQNYFTISHLRFSTDRKAINEAKRINPSLEYEVVNQTESEVVL
jgi:hypothetical protein